MESVFLNFQKLLYLSVYVYTYIKNEFYLKNNKNFLKKN